MADGQLAYVTKRFDLNGQKKLAVEDLCQLSELLTEQKYRASHEKAGKVIRKYSSIPGDDILRYFELIVFSFAIGNNDMHLKNFSLMTDDPTRTVLSPAYDLLSVRLLLSINEDPEELALSVNAKKNKLFGSDFMALAETLKIPEKAAAHVLKKQINNESKMQAFIKKSFLSNESQERLIDLLKTKALS